MIAANIMTTGVYTLTMDKTLLDAIRLIRDKSIRQVPIVDRENRVLGVVTPRALMKGILPKYISEGLLEDVKFAPELPDFIKNIETLCEKKIEEIMEREYTAVLPETYTMEIAAIFVNPHKNVESILVIDDQKRLLGIISPWDVFKRLCEYTDRKKIQ